MRDTIKKWWKHIRDDYYGIAIAIIIIGIPYLIYDNWQWLIDNHEIVRNYVLVIAAMVALPLSIWRSKVAQDTLNHQTSVHITTIYKDSITHLASEKPSIRLAAIHTLRKVSEDSDFYKAVILEILYSFLKENSRELLDLIGISANYSSSEDDSKLEKALDKHRAEYLDQFSEAVKLIIDISNKLNRQVCFDNKTNLQEISLYPFSLNFPFNRPFMNNPFRRVGADLFKASLQMVDLSGADLRYAMLQNANLKEAYLTSANLEDADLINANLEGTHLRGCKYNSNTQFPVGFDPKKHGMIDEYENHITFIKEVTS